MPEQLDVDVCVVGAGYAGLTAAASFTFGTVAERVDALDETQRRRAVIKLYVLSRLCLQGRGEIG